MVTAGLRRIQRSEPLIALLPWQIGIDTQGTKYPFADSIVWSAVQASMDTYSLFTVEATAASDTIVVLTRSRPDFCVTQNDTYWDNASLVAIGQAEASPTEAAAQPTTAPSSGVTVGTIPVAQPRGDGSVVHTVNSGETLIGIVVTYDQAYGGRDPSKVFVNSMVLRTTT